MNSEPHDLVRIERCLSLCRLDPRLYSIGPFFKRGLTVFKQQVRALNLVYGIHTAGKHRDCTIAIIGGGVAGVTAAAAATALGWEVDLFEQRPVLCHLQHGCDTRWLHPHIYDWPQPGSDDPYAGLPLLNWKEGTAATVAEQIMTEFEEIKEAANAGAKDRLRCHLGATTQLSKGSRVKWDNSEGKPRGGEREFDVIVLSVGFGVEASVHEGLTPSYWRNDSVNQPKPGITSEKPDLYFVTGTGDGGLIDLLRCRIKSFNQGRIIDELLPPDDGNYTKVIERLRDIVDRWRNSRNAGLPENWLFNQYYDLDEKELLRGLAKRVEKRLRPDAAAILNGRGRTFSEALSLNNASMFNTLLTYLLYQLKAFSYVYGEFRLNEHEHVLIEQPANARDPIAKKSGKKHSAADEQYEIARTVPFKYDYLTIRHGVNSRQTLLSVGLSETQIVGLKEQQEQEAEFDTIESLWPAGWWSKHINLPGWLPQEPIEFVPPATLTMASTFVSTLSDILIQLYKERAPEEREFRITLHRILEIQGKKFFQQVAYYAGNAGPRLTGSPGRVFPLETGLVGLVCRQGAPIRATKKTEADWQRLWSALMLTEHDAKPVDPKVSAIMGCPFFIPSDNPENPNVCLVLFIDSEQPDFFTQSILDTIFAASAGFVSNLDERVRCGDVRFATRSFRGFEPKLQKRDSALFRKYKDTLEVLDGGEFGKFVHKLTFQRVRSFDAELQLPKLGREPRNIPKSPA